MENILKEYAIKYINSNANYFINEFSFIKKPVGYDVIPSYLYVRYLEGIEPMKAIRLLKLRKTKKLITFLKALEITAR